MLERFAPAYFIHVVRNPYDVLAETCAYLGVDAPADYLDASAAIVLTRPEGQRNLVHWDEAARQRVEDLIARHDFLTGYRFHD